MKKKYCKNYRFTIKVALEESSELIIMVNICPLCFFPIFNCVDPSNSRNTIRIRKVSKYGSILYPDPDPQLWSQQSIIITGTYEYDTYGTYLERTVSFVLCQYSSSVGTSPVVPWAWPGWRALVAPVAAFARSTKPTRKISPVFTILPSGVLTQVNNS